MKKIRVTIDLEDTDSLLTRDELGSREYGVFGIDEGGVYHMFYHSRSELCTFTDIEVLK